MESDFEFEYQMSLRLVHKLLSKVDKRKPPKTEVTAELTSRMQMLLEAKALHSNCCVCRGLHLFIRKLRCSVFLNVKL